MTILEMLEQSGVLTLLGMGVVFSFLIIMIFAMTALNKALHVAGMDKEEKPQTTLGVPPAIDKKAIVVAIATALKNKNK